MITAQWTPEVRENEARNSGASVPVVLNTPSVGFAASPEGVTLPFGHSIVPPSVSTPMTPVHIGTSSRAFNG